MASNDHQGNIHDLVQHIAVWQCDFIALSRQGPTISGETNLPVGLSWWFSHQWWNYRHLVCPPPVGVYHARSPGWRPLMCVCPRLPSVWPGVVDRQIQGPSDHRSQQIFVKDKNSLTKPCTRLLNPSELGQNQQAKHSVYNKRTICY